MMNTKMYSSMIIALLVVGIMLAMPVASVQAWGWRRRGAVTKIAFTGFGIPQDPPVDLGTLRAWGDKTLLTGFKRNFDVTIWTNLAELGNSDEADPRLTGIHKTEWTIFSYPDGQGGESSRTFAKEQLIPGASCGGWWTGYQYGRMWNADEPIGFFGTLRWEFHTKMWGRGAFAGMKLVMTVSSAESIATGFGINGYILTS
jgi:hypothetical protein